MSSPNKRSKGTPAPGLGLDISDAEIKILIFGLACSTPGKVDFDLLAKRGGYTKASAKVLFGKAKRKLATLFPEENVTDTQDDSSTANPQAVENSGAAHLQGAQSAADTVVKEEDTDLLSEYLMSPMSTGLKRKHSLSEEEDIEEAISFDI
ncbi:hypothetical protein N7509_007896 [Penicillium cosmopolitanum]|uniref:Uncharacterized protein n=1 Tax=Penicillium cosmopolitanum TaxID=1131564 RepID=A0A9X0B8W3_9EURO|nr:uncharacterized protein N7509_007896 [Penicillium cosmopolitanum]KAJ5392406.1 hypothetical protein N7509_007896 [Penicillium cosmopolitanum]